MLEINWLVPELDYVDRIIIELDPRALSESRIEYLMRRLDQARPAILTAGERELHKGALELIARREKGQISANEARQRLTELKVLAEASEDSAD